MLIFNSNTIEEIIITGACVQSNRCTSLYCFWEPSVRRYCSFKGLTRLYHEEQPDLLISLWLYVVMVVSDRYSSIPYRYRQTGGIVPQCVLLSEASGPTQSKLEAARPVSQIIGYN